MTNEDKAWLTSPLLTDLYQLTMLQGYFDGGMNDVAVFEFFVRRLPPERNFLMAAGLEQVLNYLQTLAFDDADIAALSATGLFGDEFLDHLRGLRFTGDVDAMPEGTVFFPNEPVLQIRAPLPEAQFVESRLINLLHFQTLIASKAARCMLAAGGKRLVDFGMRRAHGAEAALFAARASYLAGFTGTATVLAQPRFGIPIFGTMAHSFIQAHDSEAEAFARFAASHRGDIVLLIDTYDTEVGAHRVVDLARRLDSTGFRIRSVRLDSGDLDTLSRQVRRILNDGGCADVEIFASGGLDERQIQALRAGGAPIDGFGVGTALDVSADAPALDCVYKLQEYQGKARRKRSPGKATLPGYKRVLRSYDTAGRLAGDVLTIAADDLAGESLLQPVMRAGLRLAAAEDLHSIRTRAARALAQLPEPLRTLDRHVEYPVRIAPALARLVEETDAFFR